MLEEDETLLLADEDWDAAEGGEGLAQGDRATAEPVQN